MYQVGSGSELALGITILINNDNTGCYVRGSGTHGLQVGIWSYGSACHH